MREILLSFLRCPKCKQSSFSIIKNELSQFEIRSGKIQCCSCGVSYQILNGIVDFLNDANENVIRERKAMDDDKYIIDEAGNKYRIADETIQMFKRQFLSLPEGDGSYFFKRGGSFQSFAEASDRFYATLDRLSLTGREKILEIGACFSHASYKFAKKGCYVVAMDISNYLKVSELFIKDAYFERIFSDMHNLPFIDNTFDIVFGAAVLHHSKDLKGVFTEIYRVLKKYGKLVLINEASRGVLEKVHPVFEKMQNKGFGDTAYTIPQWIKSVKKGGFRKAKIEYLSLADDYITRHRNRGTKNNAKLKLAYFFKKHRKIEKIILFILILPRRLFRPKSWRFLCYK